MRILVIITLAAAAIGLSACASKPAPMSTPTSTTSAK
jgi:hypothetical protein